MSQDITIPGDEAYMSFGGWAKPMQNPPAIHERRRYIIDVECTGADLTTSSKGERGTRKLSILRVEEVVGVVVPPMTKAEKKGEGDDTPAMFDATGDVSAEASADEGDEIRARMDEERAAKEAAADTEVVDDAVDNEEPGDADWPEPAATGNDGSGNVSALFKAADDG